MTPGEIDASGYVSWDTFEKTVKMLADSIGKLADRVSDLARLEAERLAGKDGAK